MPGVRDGGPILLHADDHAIGPDSLGKDAGEQASAAEEVQGALTRPWPQAFEHRVGQQVGGTGMALPEAGGTDPPVAASGPLGEEAPA